MKLLEWVAASVAGDLLTIFKEFLREEWKF